jgi:hypothetical protein
MRAQPSLLDHLIDYWHPYVEAFMLEGQSLTLTMKDIYFLIGLSRRGEPVNLRKFPLGSHNIEDYIGMYYEDGTEKVGSQMPIHKITSLNLWIVLYLIGRITGSTTLHHASCAHMYCATQRLDATMFHWCTTILTYMKKQLIDFQRRKNNKFGFETVICTLFFERVPSISPREIV